MTRHNSLNLQFEQVNTRVETTFVSDEKTAKNIPKNTALQFFIMKNQ